MEPELVEGSVLPFYCKYCLSTNDRLSNEDTNTAAASNEIESTSAVGKSTGKCASNARRGRGRGRGRGRPSKKEYGEYTSNAASTSKGKNRDTETCCTTEDISSRRKET